MGLYKFRKELLERLVQEGNEVHVLMPFDEYTNKIKHLGVLVVDISLNRRGVNPIQDFQLLKNYVREIKRIKPDVVLTYTIKPNIFGGMACRITKTPYLTNITGLGTAIENKGILNKIVLYLYQIGLKNATTIFFQNDYNLNYMKKKLKLNNNLVLLPGSGVNVEEYGPLPYPKKGLTLNLLFIGRVMKDKGIEELIFAAKELKDVAVNIHVVGGCDEDYENELRDLTKQNILTYHGQQIDVKPFIEEAHAIILPSYHEGTANVLLEGGASARPLIASNIPGCREIIDYDMNGYVFAPKEKEILLQTINQFVELPYEMKKRFGEMSRLKVVREFNREIVIDTYIKAINKVGGK